MENEQKKSNNSNRFYVVIVALLLCTVIGYAVRGCGNYTDPAELYQRTDAAVERIEAEHTDAGRELDIVSGQLNSAGAAVGRTDELVDRSQECVIRNTESVIECQQIVSECRKIVADCNRIYAEAEKANRSGTESGSGS